MQNVVNMRLLVSYNPPLCKYSNRGTCHILMCVACKATTPTNIQMNTVMYLDWKLCSRLIDWSGYLIQRVNKRKIKVKSPMMNISLDLLNLWLTGLYNSSPQVSTVPDHPRQLMGLVNWRKRTRLHQLLGNTASLMSNCQNLKNTKKKKMYSVNIAITSILCFWSMFTELKKQSLQFFLILNTCTVLVNTM